MNEINNFTFYINYIELFCSFVYTMLSIEYNKEESQVKYGKEMVSKVYWRQGFL